jgi:hypothetical protein
MYSLGMKKLSWENLGRFNANPTHRDHLSMILCETSKGALIFTAGPSFEILDFRGNKRYLLNEISASLLAIAKPPIDNPFNYFFINDHIVLYDLQKKQVIGQIRLDSNKLTLASTSVYETGFPISWWPIGIFAVLIAAILAFVLFKKSRKQPRYNISQAGNGSNGHTVASFQKSLTPIENEVLEKIKTDTIAGKRTTTNCLNKILGTDKKSPETQKSQRSKTLTAINDKYKLYHKTDMKLINHMRMEEDKRLVEYYIELESLHLITE